MALDERLRRELEGAGEPADPAGVYEQLIRRREHHRVTRRAARGVLALAVIAGCVVGIVVLSRVFTASESQLAGPAGEGILFEDLIGQRSDLFVVQPDGSGLEQLTRLGDVGSGSWSPDGKRIVFARYDERVRSADLFVMDPHGSDVERLTDTPELSEGRARWSPDGSRIAFEATPSNGPGGIYVMSADGESVQRLTPDATDAGSPDWSPDGSQLVFVSGPARPDPTTSFGPTSQIWIMDADGTDPYVLTTGRSANYSPRWSPDGDRIVFTRDRDIYVVNVDGTGLINLTPESGTDYYDRDPAWSSDGDRIVFASTRSFSDSQSLFTMDPDGGDIRPLIGRAIGFCCPEPDWRGDAATAEPEPSPTQTPVPDDELGLGFPVCNVSSIDGHFVAPDNTSTVSVATRKGDVGGCPAPEEAFNVVALDVDHDGLADTSYGPIECTLDCRAFSAPDIDGDGTDELLVVQDGGAVVGLRLYDVVEANGETSIVPVDVADPGDPRGGFEPGKQASFLLGGDAFELYTLSCGDPAMRDGPGLVVTMAESLPHDSVDARWHAHRITFALVDGSLRLMDVGDFTEPVTDDPSGPSFRSGETLCGSKLGVIAPIP